jgi:hypothetical protein
VAVEVTQLAQRHRRRNLDDQHPHHVRGILPSQKSRIAIGRHVLPFIRVRVVGQQLLDDHFLLAVAGIDRLELALIDIPLCQLHTDRDHLVLEVF